MPKKDQYDLGVTNYDINHATSDRCLAVLFAICALALMVGAVVAPS